MKGACLDLQYLPYSVEYTHLDLEGAPELSYFASDLDPYYLFSFHTD